MGRFSLIVLTRCEPGRDDEFNRWYDEVHLPDLLAIPGITGASRARLADVQLAERPDGFAVIPTPAAGLEHPYLAVYTIEADDPAAVLREIGARSGSERMVLSPALADAVPMLFEDRAAAGASPA